MENAFVEHVDIQNALFEALRKYDSVAFGDRQLFPSFWDKGSQPQILSFMGDTSNKIKAIHATKKRQLALAEAASEASKDINPGKGKTKVCRPCLCRFSFDASLQSKVQLFFSSPALPGEVVFLTPIIEEDHQVCRSCRRQ